MGFFDIQVNGYAGFDFNTELISAGTADEIEAVCLRFEQLGVDSILATVITDAIPVMEGRLRRLVALLSQSPAAQRVIRGIHVEGPFLNPAPGYRGAHPVDSIISANTDAMQKLLDAAEGMIKLVTLAPEADEGRKVTSLLAKRSIVVSAGHTDASLDQLRACIDAGLSMFTHLGNGCPGTMNRHNNIIQRALSLHRHLWLCFIADGVHVPFFALRNYLDSTGLDKVIVTTDCMIAAELGSGRFTFGRWDLNIGEDLVARSPDGSHLIGSTITMPKTYDNLIQHLGLTPIQAQLVMDKNPRAALNI